MSTPIITIAGVDRTDLYTIESLRVSAQLNGRNSVGLALRDPDAAYHPAVGQLFRVNDYAAVVLRDNPVGYWRLGENSGTTAADASGNGHDGTYIGSPTLGATGLLVRDSNTAVSFDGVDDEIDYGTKAAFALSTIAVEQWVKFGPVTEVAGSERLFDGRNSSGVQKAVVQWQQDGARDGEILCVVNAGGVEDFIVGTTQFKEGDEAYIVFTYNGSTMRLFVNGAEELSKAHSVGGSISWGTVDAAWKAGVGGQIPFEGVLDEQGVYTVLSASQVKAHYDAGVASGKFNGTLERVRERVEPGTGLLVLGLEAVDFNQLADRPLVAEIYENQTMKQIVEDIRLDHLDADGVTLDPDFPDGPTFERVPFDHVTPATAFDELSEMTGFVWDIGYDKVLRFLDRSSLTAPANLTDTAGVWLAEDGLEVERTRERYRNEQIIRGGSTVTDTSLTETFLGDGDTASFPLSLDVDSIVSIEVNSVAQTVGVRGVDTGKDWYYQEGDKIISQDSGGVKLTSSDTLEVVYFGQFPLRVLARDVSKIAERQAVEGGSGLYSAIEDFEDIDRLALGRDRAEGLIRRFGSIDARVSFTSRTLGWQPGQLIPTVNLPKHSLTSQLLVSEVELFDHAGIELRARITAVSGEAVDTWVAFFKKLAQGGRRKSQRANEVLHLIRAFTEPVEVTETFAAASAAARAFQWNRSVGNGSPAPEDDQVGLSQWN